MKRNHQKGFTLIELLVVIAILGILSAIVAPRVAYLIGRGAVEGANTEAHNVQVAVMALMTEETLTDFDGTVNRTSTTGAENYLTNVGQLQASYTFTDGILTSATPYADGKWKSLTYTQAKGWQK